MNKEQIVLDHLLLVLQNKLFVVGTVVRVMY